MAIVFHEADDSCAPFPHRVIYKPARTIVARNIPVTFPEQSFVICASCDHWILVGLPCACPQRCHDFGRMLLDLAPPETRETDPRHPYQDGIESGYQPDALSDDFRESRS